MKPSNNKSMLDKANKMKESVSMRNMNDTDHPSTNI